MIATYRLSKHLCSFDFYDWLVMVAALGAKEIVFDLSNPRISWWPHDVMIKRFYSIMEPGPAFLGLPSRLGHDVGELDMVSRMWEWALAGRTFPRLATVRPPASKEYTVTIRDSDTHKERDSNRAAWIRFAETIGAEIIEDDRIKPIHLHDRMALYAGARMNFGVCNGPMHLITLSSYPVTMVVNNAAAAKSQRKKGNVHGGKFPWMLPNQRMEWVEDSYDNLCRMFDTISDRRD